MRLQTNDITEARTALKELVDWTASPALTDAMVDAFLHMSLVKDGEGRLPGSPGYQATYALLWAAHLVARRKALLSSQSSGVVKFTSEGTTVERSAVDWQQVATLFARDAAEEMGLAGSGVHVFELQPSLPGLSSRWPWLDKAITNE